MFTGKSSCNSLSSARFLTFLIFILTSHPFLNISAQEEPEFLRRTNQAPRYNLGPQLLPEPARTENDNGVPGPLLLETSCPNSNFSAGTWDGWKGCYGFFALNKNCQVQNFLTTGAHPLHKMVPAPGWLDAQSCFNLNNIFPGELFSARLGDTMYTQNPGNPRQIYKEAELEYAVQVTSSTYLFIYRYAILLQSTNHPNDQQPDFKVQITDADGLELDPVCGSYYVASQNGGTPVPGWSVCAGIPDGDVFWKPWTTVAMDLTPYFGQKVYIKFKVRGCSYDTHFGYAYISTYCSALTIQTALCNNALTATLTAPPGFESYLWNTGETTESITVTAPVDGAQYWVDVTSHEGLCTAHITNVLHYTIITADFTNEPACLGQPTQFSDLSTINQNQVVGWDWDFDDATPVAHEQNPIHTFTIPGTHNVTLTSYSTEGCPNTITIPVFVATLPLVNPILNQAYCHDEVTTITAVTSPSGAGATFAWTNSDPTIGLAASGTGNIPSFTATNNTTSPVTSNVTIIPTVSGCPGTPLIFTITVNPLPTVNTITNQTWCDGISVPLNLVSSPVGAGTTFSWTNSIPANGLAASGTGDIDAFIATNAGITSSVADITITPTFEGCVGTPLTYTITVNPTPTVNTILNQIFCNGDGAPATPVSSPVGPATTFTWTNSIPANGLAASGTGNIDAFIAINAGIAPTMADITITPSAHGCPGTPFPYTLTVNPTPTVNAILNQIYCNGDVTLAIPVSSPVGAGTTFTWTNSIPSNGLAASGTGSSIPIFNATNTGDSPTIADITIIPTANGCPGTPLTFTITVNPTPTVNAILNQIYCNGDLTLATPVSSPVGAGTTFAWTNSIPANGLAANGTGDIPFFNATNIGNSPSVADITVTPQANGCPGTPLTYTITINPTPTVNSILDPTYCNGDVTLAIPVSSPVGAGTTFTWTNSIPANGLAASGTGSIPFFNATNTGDSPSVADITITPAANGCVGTPLTFTITVNPTPTVNAILNQIYCNGDVTLATPVSSPVGAGTTFTWTNSIPANGLAASGTGSIPVFNATNNGISPAIADITITPAANGCPGTPLTYTITINPTPTVNSILDQIYCNGDVTLPTTFSSPVGAGTTFTWTNSIPANGLAASGTESIPIFNATNNSNSPSVADITITPEANGCPGTPLTFTIT